MPGSGRERTERPLRRREPNALGARCAESQADGVPCPDPHCDCQDCARSYEPYDPAEAGPGEATARA